ncbi:hypothetical protein [Breoghania sp. L-A4]|uniref:hypothetical protein n=1 Tax=Breoghania sp. L-A4 TaxID=2304600 RepID=UPI000E35EDFC|nr:hypothetical protein [Breoghania sp. L-A4]AXS40218.1 hypothetical protein D1F64_09310 [Breoghania sp. L-A4]
MKMPIMHLCALTLVLAIAMSLAATASLIAAPNEQSLTRDATITNRSAKQDRAEVSDTRETLRVRCVEAGQLTSCTGWPAEKDIVVGRL